MPQLKTIEEVIDESESPVYIVSPFPNWRHCRSDSLPTPLAVWMEQHYPDVAIARMSNSSLRSLGYCGNEDGDKLLSDLRTSPIFLIGFNSEQAAHFLDAWRNPPLDTPESPSSFYFLTCDNSSDSDIREDEECLFRYSQAEMAFNELMESGRDFTIDTSLLTELDSMA